MTTQRAVASFQRAVHAAGAPEPVVRLVDSAPRRAYELLLPHAREVRAARRSLARRFIAGDGLEIGALNRPLPLPRSARARSIDRMSVDELRREYPELAGWDLVDPDIIDDGETLATIPDSSVDFVIANHFIEHTEDPIGTLGAHLRVVRPGGVMFMAVPDKRLTFDSHRPVTPLEHLIADHDEGAARSRTDHYREWARLVDGVPEDQVAAHAAELERRRASIHFHVWTPHAFAKLLTHCRSQEALPLEIEALQPVNDEFITILRRLPG